MSIHKTGEELMAQTATAGQSVLGLEQHLIAFKERWEALLALLNDQKHSLDSNEKKQVIIEEIQRILVIITEITVYIETIIIEYKHNPVEQLAKIQVIGILLCLHFGRK